MSRKKNGKIRSFLIFSFSDHVLQHLLRRSFKHLRMTEAGLHVSEDGGEIKSVAYALVERERIVEKSFLPDIAVLVRDILPALGSEGEERGNVAEIIYMVQAGLYAERAEIGDDD